MDKQNICIAQHGSVTQNYIDKAFLLNNEICLLPNYGFDQSILETIEKLLELEERFGREAYGPPFVVKIKLFAKPATFTPTSKDIDEKVLDSLYELREQYLHHERDIHNYDDDVYKLDKIFKQMKELSQVNFIEWFNDKFLIKRFYRIKENHDGKYKSTPETEACLKQRDEYIEFFLSKVIPMLFVNPSDQVLLFPLNNGEYNENFAWGGDKRPVTLDIY